MAAMQRPRRPNIRHHKMKTQRTGDTMTSPAMPRDRILKPGLRGDLSIKLIGAGGVGGIVARYSAIYCASLDCNARLVLLDGDKFEPANATRMFFGSHGNKAEVIRQELLP